MASSETEIVNLALIKIRERRLTSLTEDSKTARTANRLYPQKRDGLIRRYRWTFAMTRASLAADSTAPLFGFDNRFRVPADTLRIIGCYDDNELQQNYTASRLPWKREVSSSWPTLPRYQSSISGE